MRKVLEARRPASGQGEQHVAGPSGKGHCWAGWRSRGGAVSPPGGSGRPRKAAEGQTHSKRRTSAFRPFGPTGTRGPSKCSQLLRCPFKAKVKLKSQLRGAHHPMSSPAAVTVRGSHTFPGRRAPRRPRVPDDRGPRISLGGGNPGAEGSPAPRPLPGLRAGTAAVRGHRPRPRTACGRLLSHFLPHGTHGGLTCALRPENTASRSQKPVRALFVVTVRLLH